MQRNGIFTFEASQTPCKPFNFGLVLAFVCMCACVQKYAYDCLPVEGAGCELLVPGRLPFLHHSTITCKGLTL